jgi:hypothetical protein
VSVLRRKYGNPSCALLAQFKVGNFRASALKSQPCNKWLSFFSLSQEILANHRLKSDQVIKHVAQDWLKGSAVNFFGEGIESWSHDMPSSFTCVASMWRSCLM